MTRSKNQWIACEAKQYGPIGNVRHLSFGLDLILCGATTKTVRAWASNKTKPMCRDCLRLSGRLPAAPRPKVA